MAGNITSATASLSIAVANVFATAVFISNFAVDDAFAAEPVDVAETMMGVDGHMSAGWIPAIRKMEITLMADSPSMTFFDTWAQQNDATKTPNYAQGILTLPAINASFTLINGVLKSYPSLPSGKKVLQPRKFSIDWEHIIPVQTGLN